MGSLRHTLKNSIAPEEQSSSRLETYIYEHQMTKQRSFYSEIHYQNVEKISVPVRNLNLQVIFSKRLVKVCLVKSTVLNTGYSAT